MAKEKGSYPDVYDELLRIRRDADSGLNPDLLAGSPKLCALMGDGDPFLAVGQLRDRLSTAAANSDREILAYYYSLFGPGDATARLNRAGDKLAVENRRARDLSDAGALKLAQLIGSRQEWQVPFMGCALSIIGWNATIEAYVAVAKGFLNYRHPRFMLGDEELQLDHRRADQERWDRHFYGPHTVALEDIGDAVQFRMRRIGTHKMRVNTMLRSNNAEIDVTSTLMLLSYVLDFKLNRRSDREVDDS